MVSFQRDIYFDAVRDTLFGGKLTQGQVDGQEAILTVWERRPTSDDLRHLSYMLATTKHETASTMLPIEEYGQGAGMSYGNIDPETGQRYYGRGFVQLTWRDNYRRATDELHLRGEYDLEWHAERALGPIIAAAVMFRGMWIGWFRTGDDGQPENLEKYFDVEEDVDDPFEAREIINGDKYTVPSWSHGVSIGQLIADYHRNFLTALNAAVTKEPAPEPEPPEPELQTVTITLEIDAPTTVEVAVNVVEKH